MSYETNVFINCPFDDAYTDFIDAALFAVYRCNFKPRCALEINDAGDQRLDKINRIIKDCKIGIHDISRTELDHVNNLPREGANKQVISSQADSLIKISRIWADFFPANTSNQPI